MTVSPCVSICKHEEDTEQCVGCRRTFEERKIWKDPETTDDWKYNNIAECQRRMTEQELSYWNKSYEFKMEHGLSMKKYAKQFEE